VTNEGIINEEYKNKFNEVMFNDLNTPQAVALIWTLLKDDTVSGDDKYRTILSYDEVLGLGLSEAKKEKIVVPDTVKELLEARASARLAGNYEESDRLRDEISNLGYTVKDGKDGQEITVK
jgi:cysteinyl-tRNA synthetase